MATGRQYVHRISVVAEIVSRDERKHPHQTRREFTASFDINMQHAGQDLLLVGWLMEVGGGRNPEVEGELCCMYRTCALSREGREV